VGLPMSHTLASGSADHTVKLWDPVSGKLLRTLEGHQRSVYAWRLITGGTLASGSADNT